MAIKLTAKPWQMMRPICRHLQSSTLIALWSIVKIKLRLLHPTNNLMSKMMSSPSLSTSSVKWETITRLKWHNSPKRCKRLKRSTTTLNIKLTNWQTDTKILNILKILPKLYNTLMKWTLEHEHMQIQNLNSFTNNPGIIELDEIFTL